MNDLPPREGADAAAALLERARAGDSDAFGELYRLEVDAARRLAGILVGNDRADELVSESFAKVLTQLNAGRGPTEDFRAYLHVTIRNGYRDAMRATKEAPSSDQPWLLDDVLPPVEDLVEDLDRDVAVSALATLPKSWQQVLWHLEVEGRKPAEVAGLLDMDAGAVSSLAYRAREGLKRAYLDQHLQPVAGGACGWTQTRMSQYVRGDLSARAEAKVAAHLDECGRCSAAYVAVDRVNQKLAAWLFPVVLWGITGAKKGGLLWFAAAGGGAGGAAAGTAGGGTPTSGPNPVLLGAAATVVAAGVVGGMAVALTAGNGGHRDGAQPAADSSRQVDSPPAAPPQGPEDQAPPRHEDAQQVVAPPPTTASTQAPSVPVVAPTPTVTPTVTPTPTPTPSGTPTPTDTPSTTPSSSPSTTPSTSFTPSPTTTPPDPVVAGLGPVTVAEAPDGNPARGPFEVTVVTTATGDAPGVIQVHLDLDDVWMVSDLTPAGDWQCGLLVEAGLSLTDYVTCTHDYDGTAVPPLVLRTEAPLPTGPAVKPHGTATLEVDGEPGDPGSATF